MEDKEEIKLTKPIKQEQPDKMVKVGVKDKAAFSGREGENITIWGNIFTVGDKGELVSEIPEFLAKEGVAVGRYIIL